MPFVAKKIASLKTVLSAAKKLTVAERQLLKLQLFGNDALDEMKTFEQQLKQRKQTPKKTDAEVVKLTTEIRYR